MNHETIYGIEYEWLVELAPILRLPSSFVNHSSFGIKTSLYISATYAQLRCPYLFRKMNL